MTILTAISLSLYAAAIPVELARAGRAQDPYRLPPPSRPAQLAAERASEQANIRLGAEILTIGSQAGAEEYVFGRIENVVRLSNSMYVVSDGTANVLRIYNRAGRHLITAGRKGRGPGEFENLGWIAECAPDSIFAYDYTEGRIAVFSAKGAFTRSFAIRTAGTPSPPYQWRCSRSGLLVVVGWPRYENVRTEHYRRPVIVGVAGLDGSVARAVGTFPGDERTRHARSDGPRAFGQRLIVAVDHDRILIGPGGDFSISIYSAQGDSIGSFRGSVSTERIRPAAIRAYKDSLIRSARPEFRASWARQLAKAEFPENYPPYDNIIADSERRVWVRRYPKPGDRASQWIVLSPAGAVIASVSMPLNYLPTQIERDSVVGIWTDSLGVPYVRVYALR